MTISSINPDLPARLKTAAFLVISFLAFVIFAIYSPLGAKLLALITFALVATAGYEFCKLPEVQAKASIYSRLGILLAPAFLVLLSALVSAPENFQDNILSTYFLSIFIFMAIGLTIHSINSKVEGQLNELFFRIARDGLGFILIAIGGGAAVSISVIAPLQALILVAIVSVADAAAYFAGRSFGKSRIAPVVSPKKTVVGTVVGIASGSLLGTVIFSNATTECFLPIPASLFFSAILVICSQTGDYAKSIIKRHFDVKDFGTIFPGHGGALDRLDGILGAAPFLLVMVASLCKAQ